MKKNKNKTSSLKLILIILLIICLVSLVMTIFDINGSKTAISEAGTLTTSVISVRNLFSGEGLAIFFNSLFLNLSMYIPVITMLFMMVAVSIGYNSGYFVHMFAPLKRYKSIAFTFVTVLISILFGFFGENGFLVIVPLAAIVYKSAHKSPLLGAVTSFLGYTLGGSFIYLFSSAGRDMGKLLELSASTLIDSNYIFNNKSIFVIIICFSIIILFLLTILIELFISKRFKKNEEEVQEFAKNKRAFTLSNIVLIVMGVIIIYGLLPGAPLSGYFLGSGNVYFDRAFGSESIFIKAFPFLIGIMFMIASFVYGKSSGRIKEFSAFGENLFNGLQNIGPFVVLSIFFIQIINLLKWTNLGDVITTNLIDFLTKVEFSGIPLIAVFFLIVIVISFIVPSIRLMWEFIYPLIIPLFMRANMAPELALVIFNAAAGMAKALTPMSLLLILTVGLMNNYNTQNKKVFVSDVIEMISPVALITIFVVLFLLILWFMVGIPLGIGVLPTL